MNNPHAMSWLAFKEKLSRHQSLDLHFQYSEKEWVKPSYHITEIKQAPITSVDCGGKVNRWTEIIVQLWEPEDGRPDRAMKVSKALSIVELVERTIDLDLSAEVKVEFGNQRFDMRQMYPSEVVIEGENLIVNLKSDMVQCKALGRNQTCGSPNADEACCSSNGEEKSKIEIKTLKTSGCCTPGSGCC